MSGIPPNSIPRKREGEKPYGNILVDSPVGAGRYVVGMASEVDDESLEIVRVIDPEEHQINVD